MHNTVASTQAPFSSIEWRFGYTDVWIAVKLSFLAEEQIICCAKLGPSTSESFFEHRLAVEQARTAAYIAVNGTNAGKLERKLARLGVTHDRVDLMKPVLLRLSRKVDPEELFPGQAIHLKELKKGYSQVLKNTP